MLPITQAEEMGMSYQSRIIDLDHVDIAAATKVEHGPVLVISFQTQQIIYVQNSKGDIVEGDAVSESCFLFSFLQRDARSRDACSRAMARVLESLLIVMFRVE